MGDCVSSCLASAEKAREPLQRAKKTAQDRVKHLQKRLGSAMANRDDLANKCIASPKDKVIRERLKSSLRTVTQLSSMITTVQNRISAVEVHEHELADLDGDKDLMDAMDEMNRFAKRTGIDVDKVQRVVDEASNQRSDREEVSNALNIYAAEAISAIGNTEYLDTNGGDDELDEFLRNFTDSGSHGDREHERLLLQEPSSDDIGMEQAQLMGVQSQEEDTNYLSALDSVDLPRVSSTEMLHSREEMVVY